MKENQKLKEKVWNQGKKWLREKGERYAVLKKDGNFWKIQALNICTFLQFMMRKMIGLTALCVVVSVFESAFREWAHVVESDYANYSLATSVLALLLMVQFIGGMFRYWKDSSVGKLGWGLLKASVASMLVLILLSYLENRGFSLTRVTDLFFNLLSGSLGVWVLCRAIEKVALQRIAKSIRGFVGSEEPSGKIQVYVAIADKWVPYLVPIAFNESYKGVVPKKGLSGEIEVIRSLSFRLRYSRLDGTLHQRSTGEGEFRPMKADRALYTSNGRLIKPLNIKPLKKKPEEERPNENWQRLVEELPGPIIGLSPRNEEENPLDRSSTHTTTNQNEETSDCLRRKKGGNERAE